MFDTEKTGWAQIELYREDLKPVIMSSEIC